MTETAHNRSEGSLEDTEFTSSELRMLNMLAMLPSPDALGDGIDVHKAREFWYLMSERLGTVRDSSGKISASATHAGTLIEEAIAGIHRGGQVKNRSLEHINPALELRMRTSQLARRTFAIFGDLTDRQFVALGEELLGSFARTSPSFVHEWLRQFRETAMNVIIESKSAGRVGEGMFEHLDRTWGRPRGEGHFFPRDLDGLA